MATIPALTQPEITIDNGQAVTTSLAVANFFSKRHDDVLKKDPHSGLFPRVLCPQFCGDIDFGKSTERWYTQAPLLSNHTRRFCVSCYGFHG